MKTKLIIFLLLLFHSYALYAYVLDGNDTTQVILHKEPTSGPIIKPVPNIGPNSLFTGKTIIGNMYGTMLSFPASSFISTAIEMTITDWNDVEIVNAIVYENSDAFNIDISPLYYGVYTISILDGDDEYIGEFEVF